MFKEFKTFITKGNAMDLAVGVIIGGAFNRIVTSIVNDLIMPLISLITGKQDFSSWFVVLNGEHYPSLAAATEAGAPLLTYGNFISAVLDFLIIGFVLFLIVRTLNKVRDTTKDKIHFGKRAKNEPAAPPAPPTTKVCPFCRNTVPIEATRCGFCTSHLTEEGK